jgi:dTDP-4-dehydrorhamnose reductase
MSASRPILLLGAGGQLGQAAQRRAAARNHPLVALTRRRLDICDQSSLRFACTAVQPSVIVNAAAYTAVDRAEQELDAAYTANILGAANVALAARDLEVPLLHVSTDYVFDGLKGAPYAESDSPAPLGIYGRSKLEGEQAALSIHPGALVLRTAGVFGLEGGNFVLSILNAAAKRGTLEVVDDQRGCPTFADDLADALLDVAQHVPRDGVEVPERIVHLCGATPVTRFEFAQQIVALAAPRTGHQPHVAPVKTVREPGQALRPANSALDCGKARRAFGLEIPGWENALPRMLNRHLGAPRCRSVSTRRNVR